MKSLGVTTPALGAQPLSCTRVVTPGARLLPCTRVSAVSGCWLRKMPRGVWNIHTPSPTESPPSPTSRTTPSSLLGGHTEDLGLAQTWPLPSLTGPWGGSGGCIHPSGWWLPPSLPPCGRHSAQSQTRGLAGVSAVQACPDPSWSQSGAEATRWAGRLWDLGPRLPSWAALNLGCQELGTMASWNSGLVLVPAGTQMGPIPHRRGLCQTYTDTHTYSHTAQMHTHTPVAFQAQHRSSQQRWTPLTRTLAQMGAPSPPTLGPHALVHVASPPMLFLPAPTS